MKATGLEVQNAQTAILYLSCVEYVASWLKKSHFWSILPVGVFPVIQFQGD